MPIYNDGKNQEDPKTSREPTKPDTKTLVKHPKILLFCGLFFCLFSCGVESSFHSQIFTFALCGPHQLSPQQVSSPIHFWRRLLFKRIIFSSGSILDYHICSRILGWAFLRYLQDVALGLFVLLTIYFLQELHSLAFCLQPLSFLPQTLGEKYHLYMIYFPTHMTHM